MKASGVSSWALILQTYSSLAASIYTNTSTVATVSSWANSTTSAYPFNSTTSTTSEPSGSSDSTSILGLGSYILQGLSNIVASSPLTSSSTDSSTEVLSTQTFKVSSSPVGSNTASKNTVLSSTPAPGPSISQTNSSLQGLVTTTSSVLTGNVSIPYVQNNLSRTTTQASNVNHGSLHTSGLSLASTINTQSCQSSGGNATSSCSSLSGTIPTRTTTSGRFGNSTVVTGSGTSYADACSTSWYSWSTASDAWMSAFGTTYLSPIVETWPGRKTAYGIASEPYATCNGIIRVAGSFQTTAVITGPSSITTTFSVPQSSFNTRAFASSLPPPSCSVGQADCTYLLQKWHDEHPDNVLNRYGMGTFPGFGPPNDYPHCALGVQTGNYTDCFGCWLSGGKAQLYYWPHAGSVTEGTTKCPLEYSDDAQINATIPIYGNSSEARSIITTLTDTDNPDFTTVATFVSPTVYVSMGGLQAHDACSAIPGTVTGTVIPVETQSISTALLQLRNIPLGDPRYSTVLSVLANRDYAQYDEWFGTGWQWFGAGFAFTQTAIPVNEAGLGRPPVPTDYFLVPGRDFNTGDELTPDGHLYDEDYHPKIKLDPGFRLGNSAWKDCYLDVAYDPPIALTAAATLDGVTVPTIVVGTPDQSGSSPSAQPSSALIQPTASQTFTALAAELTSSSSPGPASSSSPIGPSSSAKSVQNGPTLGTSTSHGNSGEASAENTDGANEDASTSVADHSQVSSSSTLAANPPIASPASVRESSDPAISSAVSASALSPSSFVAASQTPKVSATTSSQNVGGIIASLLSQASTTIEQIASNAATTTFGNDLVSSAGDTKPLSASSASQDPAKTTVTLVGTSIVQASSRATSSQSAGSALGSPADQQSLTNGQEISHQASGNAQILSSIPVSSSVVPTATLTTIGGLTFVDSQAVSQDPSAGGQTSSTGQASLTILQATTPTIIGGLTFVNSQIVSQQATSDGRIVSSDQAASSAAPLAAVTTLGGVLFSALTTQTIIGAQQDGEATNSLLSTQTSSISSYTHLATAQASRASGAAVGADGIVSSGTISSTNGDPEASSRLALQASAGSTGVSAITIGTVTLHPGGPVAVISSTTYSLDSGGTALVLKDEDTTQVLAPAVPTTSVVASMSQIIVGSATLQAGGSAAVISSKTYSLDSAGTALMVADGSTTQMLVPMTSTPAELVGIPAITLGSATVLAGGPLATVSGTTYSLDSAGSVLVVADGTTIQTLRTLASLKTPSVSYITVGGLSVLPGSSAIVVSSQTYSLGPQGTAVVINGLTHVLTSVPASETARITNIEGVTLTLEALATSSSDAASASQTYYDTASPPLHNSSSGGGVQGTTDYATTRLNPTGQITQTAPGETGYAQPNGARMTADFSVMGLIMTACMITSCLCALMVA